MQGTALDKDTILDILKLSENSRALYQFTKSNAGETNLFMDFGQKLFVDKNFEHHIREIFNDAGEVKDSASSALGNIRKSLHDKNTQLRRVVERMLKKLSESYLVQEEYITQRDGRTVLPVKSEHKRHVKGFIHGESATGQTVYIEPEETLELNNEILSLSFEEKREIDRIFRKITEKIGVESAALRTSLQIISILDSIFAKAKYSVEVIGSFPSFDKNKTFELMDARHPVLIRKLGRDKTVPLNLTIKNEKVILITGPNAGGKTVVLKTAGIIYLLALSGFHIPVHPDSNLHYIDNVLIDIGDEQSIEDDLSTFSSHLSNIKSIIESANENSLVLIDEIGTGTDPAEGSALAVAILLTLRNKKAYTLATTHHGNLKLLANDLDGFQNASMHFDQEHLLPTYEFQQGMPGSSYAFEIADRIGFEREFLNTARNYMDPDKSKVENLLMKLENESRNLQIKSNKLEIENARLSGLSKLYEDKISKLEKQKKVILEDTGRKAEEFITNINRTLESAIKNIRESNAEKEIVKEERKKLEHVKEKFAQISEKIKKVPLKGPFAFQAGDYVSLREGGTQGKILKLEKNKKEAVVLTGQIKMRVKLSSLIPSENIVEEIYYKKNDYRGVLDSLRLDIRGKKPHEIEYDVIKFLDDAFTSSVRQVEILHGKGTGALRKSVHELLKKHEKVASFKFADIEFGGEGITMVELK